MNKRFTGVFLCIVCVAFLNFTFDDDAILEYFQPGLVPLHDTIYLKWKSRDESALKQFVIERSVDNLVFTALNAVAAKGSSSEYQYVDKSIFKTSAQTFYYRLKLEKKDGSFEYSKVVNLSPSISSVKKTWGSIKAIFH